MKQSLARPVAAATLVLALAATLGTAAAQSAGADRAGVEAALRTAGYDHIRDVEQDTGGLWEAEVRTADGRWHDVHVVADSGEVIDRRAPGATLLDAAAVTTRLAAAGYTGLRDLDLDDGLWEVDATNAQGQAVELTVHGGTGAVLVEERDG